MATDHLPSGDGSAADALPSEVPTVNLQVVSPSVGVNRPLLFPNTPASTTIKQLKAKIREGLPLRPADDHQRLIHRGKALIRETDSLIDILGAQATINPELHTIHLVLRDFERPSSTPIPPPRPEDDEWLPEEDLPPSRRPLPPQSAPPITNQQPPPQAQIPPSASFRQQLPEPAATVFQQQHQQLTAWLSQIQRDAMARAIVNQNQRGRAQGGMRGIGDTGTPGAGGPDTNSGRASPAPSHTIYREAHGPNGNSYHVETVIRPSAPGSAQHGTENAMSAQHSFRASSRPPIGAVGAAMQRSTSGASLPGRSFAQPGVTVPIPHIGGSRPESGRATPDLAGMPRSVPGLLNMFTSAPPTTPTQGVQLYLVSSPEGPRGILINNSTMEAFYTPRANPVPTRTHSPPRVPGLSIFERPELNEPIRQQQQYQLQERQPVAAAANAAHPQAPVPAPQGLHPNNAAAVGVQPLLVLILSYAWQAVRLGFFVWMFTSSDVSWTRWFVVVAVAIFVFAVGTGHLTPLAEFLWRPINRHVEQVFAALGNADGRPPRPRRARDGSSPEPADMAARLTAEHRRRQTRLGRYFRIFKRVGILFLASIAPGVAERQIAILEAEAREEIRRLQEAEAEARREAEEAEAAGESTDGEPRHEVDLERDAEGWEREATLTDDAASATPERNEEEAPAQEPLIAL